MAAGGHKATSFVLFTCQDFVLTDKVVEWAQNDGKRDIEHVHHLVAVCGSCTEVIIFLHRQTDPSIFIIVNYFHLAVPDPHSSDKVCHPPSGSVSSFLWSGLFGKNKKGYILNFPPPSDTLEPSA